MSNHRPGGGYASKNVSHVNAPKAEPKPHAINKDAVSQIGVKVGFVKDELVRGRGYSGPIGPSDNVAAVGVGGGRTIHQSGSQHGLKPARPMPPGRDPLNQE
jgi:hypothetical protein